MRRFLLVILFLASAAQAAESPVSFNFNQIRLNEFVRFAFAEVLKESYLFDSDFLANTSDITVDYRKVGRSEVVVFLHDLLSAHDFDLVKSGNLYKITKRGTVQPDEEVFFYKSKYRPVAYIMDLTSSLFKTGRFSGQRGVSNFQSTNSMISSGSGSGAIRQPMAAVNQVRDSGTSAFSMLDKPDQDSFIFQGTEKEIGQLQKLLVQIDTPVGEVLVKGTVYEVTTSEKDGSAFGLALNIMQAKFGLHIGKNSLIGDSVTFKSASIDAVFSALSTDSRFKSISNPSLRVKSGSNARFSVGSDVPVLGAVQLDKNGNPVQSVEYKPSGVIFDLKPQIRNAVIDLTINQQLSSFIPTTSGVNNSPTLIKREISTSIGAANDDVIVLGGLDEDKTSQDNSGFSFLPAWMKSRGGESSKTQILLVLQVQKI